ncbi:MAG: hypothetical protein HS108_10950 [Planctomycetes bacterium]|nr:hypothetical protein [Planctomycetota bacterium]
MRNDPDRPTPFEAILLEPDLAGRQAVLDRAQRMFIAQGGAELERLIESTATASGCTTSPDRSATTPGQA